MTSTAAAASTAREDETIHVELQVLTVKECFIYKVPPLKSASGHRAEEWGLDRPLFTGCLQIFQADTKLRIAIYSYKDQTRLIMEEENLIPFGQSFIEIKEGETLTNFVDGVVDSSRYYVVRIKDPRSTRTILIGVGFRERDTAFDFKTALNEYVKYIDRMALADKLSSLDYLSGSESGVNAGDGEGDDDEDRARLQDHRSKQSASLLQLDQHITPLKEGEKIKIKIAKRHADTTSGNTSSNSSTTKGGGMSFLKPPPQPGATVFVQTQAQLQKLSLETSERGGTEGLPADVTTEDDDDWGDFVSTK